MDEINEAINAATDEAVAEISGTKEEAPVEEEAVVEEAADEGKPEEAEPEAKPKAEEKAPEGDEEEEPLGLSAAQLEAINKSPELQAVYKSMQRGFTKKTQSLAEIRKESEEAARMVQYIRENPDQAVEEMARMRGYVIAKKEGEDAAKSEVKASASDAIDAILEKYSKDLGPESTKLLLPFMREVAEAVVQQTVAPIAERTQFLDKSAKERAIAAGVHEFAAAVKEQGGDWSDEIQAEMAKMMDRIVPGEQVNMQEYLDTLYNAVTAKQSRSAAIKAQLGRLRKAQEEAEPTRPVRPAPKVEQQITSDMSERDAIALATAMAEREANAL